MVFDMAQPLFNAPHPSAFVAGHFNIDCSKMASGCITSLINRCCRRFASTTALNTLAAAYQGSYELLVEYHEHFFQMTGAAANLEPEKDVPCFSSTALQDRVARPLGTPQRLNNINALCAWTTLCHGLALPVCAPHVAA
jgi:hypothetical protein